MRENKKRDIMLEGKTAKEIAVMKAESNLQGLENVTGGQNVGCNSLHLVISRLDWQLSFTDHVLIYSLIISHDNNESLQVGSWIIGC